MKAQYVMNILAQQRETALNELASALADNAMLREECARLTRELEEAKGGKAKARSKAKAKPE